ncbi:TerB family tellurite resistance protein [Cellulophaga baltica]|uniref:tellurite resistance TerB family protein n=1 Tax=Cellulophaga TaxID=104264 RepID=UPI001C064B56|nr:MULTISPECIES: TerB family tellurite resistance protein [Cellulophaga]MBU2997778.1 TerB family tellurite resistance protein [Cellulophaga baltica]MDO6769174.1 TerB family tellurite resistance protein [Cellulophaga sp. 1_MG-2023]
MSFVDLYSSGEHSRNLAHFASIATLASVDGEVNPKEKELLDRFARKLDITDKEYSEVMDQKNQYPIDPPNNSEKRLERLFDLFKIIFADHEIDDEEMILIKKYALGLGFSSEQAKEVISRSIRLFSGKFDFDEYLYFVKNK